MIAQVTGQFLPAEAPPPDSFSTTHSSVPLPSSEVNSTVELPEEFWHAESDLEDVSFQADALSELVRQVQGEPPREGRSKPPEFAQIGPYAVTRFIGTGGFGHVYEAVDPVSGNRLAIKVPRSDREQVSAFSRELIAGQRITHPNVVSTTHAGFHEGVPFLVSSFVEGPSLSNWLKQNAPNGMPFPAAVSLLAVLARAVEHCHALDVVHRDLKPSNILLDTTNLAGPAIAGLPERLVPRITDFGLSRYYSGSSETSSSNNYHAGTAAYMAPEQARGSKGQTGAVDVHALGVILYRVLTGRLPYQGEATGEILSRLLEDEPALPSLHRPGLPRDLETICLTCLQKRPEDRYPSAGALADDLEAFQAGRPITARGQTLWQKLTRCLSGQCGQRLALVASCLLLMASACLLIYSWNSHERYEGQRVKQEQDFKAKELESDRKTVSNAVRDVRRLQINGLYDTAYEVLNECLRKISPNTDPGYSFYALQNMLSRSLSFMPLAGGSASGFLAYTPAGGHPLLAVRNRELQDVTLFDLGTQGRLISRRQLNQNSLSYIAGLDQLLLQPMTEGLLAGRAANVSPPARLLDVMTLNSVRVLGSLDRVSPPYLQGLAGGKLVVGSHGTTRCEIRNIHDLALISETKLTGELRSMKASADGSRVAFLVARQGDVFLNVLEASTEAAQAQEVSGPLGRADHLSGWALSPDGRYVAVVIGQPALGHLLDLQTGDLRSREYASATGVVCFSEDGSLMAIGHDNGDVLIGISAEQKGIALLKTGTKPAQSLAFSQDRRTLFMGVEGDPRVWLWHLNEEGGLAPSSLPPLDLEEKLSTVTFSPDGQMMAVAGQRHLWTGAVQSHTEPENRLEVKSPITSAIFVRNRLMLATGHQSGEILIQDARTGQELQKITGHQGPVLALATNTQGNHLFSLGEDRTVRHWLVDQPGTPQVFQAQNDHPLQAMAYHPGGHNMAVLDTGFQQLTFWELARPEGPQSRKFRVGRGKALCVAYSPMGDQLVVGDDTGSITLISPENFKMRTLKRPTGSEAEPVTCLAFHPEGNILASGNEKGAVTLWDLVAEMELFEIQQSQLAAIRGLSFSPDGAKLFFVADDGSLGVLDSGKPPLNPKVSAEPDLQPGPQSSSSSLISPPPPNLRNNLTRGGLSLSPGYQR